MKLKTLNPNIRGGGDPYITIQKNGSFYITAECARKMELKQENWFQVAVEESDDDSSSLYLIESEKSDPMAISTFSGRSSKENGAYKFSSKSILRQLGVEYKNKSIRYVFVKEFKHQGKRAFEFEKKIEERG